MDEKYREVLDLNSKHHDTIQSMLDGVDWLHENDLQIGYWKEYDDDHFHKPHFITISRGEILHRMMKSFGIDPKLHDKALGALLDDQRKLNKGE